MSNAWLAGLSAFFAVTVFMGLRNVRAARHPEQKLQAFGRIAGAFAVASFATGIALLATTRLPQPGPGLAGGDGPTAAWFEAVRDHVQFQRQCLAVLCCSFALVVPSVWVVLRSLQGFVLAQRLDLATREQIAVAGAAIGPGRA